MVVRVAIKVVWYGVVLRMVWYGGMVWYVVLGCVNFDKILFLFWL